MAKVFVASTGASKWSSYALNLRNFATYRYGQEFYRTAQKAGSVIVRGYLLGYALELFLKAYLLKSGFTTTALKRKPYSHDLVTLLSAARSKGLDGIVRITPKTEQAVAALAEVYPEKLRYFSLLDLLIAPKLPALAPLFRFAKALHDELERHVRVET